jgi:L-iditol 2-dehydrogenase
MDNLFQGPYTGPTMMKALVLEEYNRLVYKDVPVPKPGAGEVLIEVKACGICGSDLHGMDGSTGRRRPPIIMGHEASGVIAALGSEVRGWSKGDRVTFDSTIYRLDDWYTRRGLFNLGDERRVLGVSCDEYSRDGAFAQFVAVPGHILYRIPEGVSFAQAAMVEPLSIAVHAAGLTPLSLGDTAVVAGAGMIGLLVVQVLRAAGCGRIVAVDLQRDRLDLALRHGADLAFNPKETDVAREVRALTDGRGADAAIEVVGIQPTIALAIDCLRKGGSITLVGNLSPRVELPLQAVVTRQLSLHGSCGSCGEYPACLDLIMHGTVNVDALLSATAPLADGVAWFQKARDPGQGLLKVILVP